MGRLVLKNLVFRPSILQNTRRGFHSSLRAASIQRREGWESVIGLEVHAQINTNSKLFSPASVQYGAPVNTQVALLDCAIPGTLPVLNRKCVEAGLLTALALSCQLNPISYFDRKHYFYADLPAGYQITQQRKAIAKNGYLKFIVFTPGIHPKPYYQVSRIRQLQLEQDSGKSLHDEEEQKSLIDLNRAGIPLMEIVFEPDLKDGEEAGALVKELSLILQDHETCSCKMEEGALRVDANVSVNRKGEPLGIRSEVKNLGSIRSLVNAVEFEVERQINLLESGGVVVNETRSYDAQAKETVPMRDKEVKQDYRFMPEPNLPPLRLSNDEDAEPDSKSNRVNIALVGKKLKELPNVTRERLVNNFDLRLESAIILVNNPGSLQYFNSVMKLLPRESGVRACNIMLGEVMEVLNERNLEFENCPIKPDTFVQIFQQIEQNQVNLDTVNQLLVLLLDGDSRSPQQIIQDEGWTKVSDDREIEKICQQVLMENPKVVESYKINQNKKQFNKLMGQVRKATDGKYDMKKVNETLQKMLDQ